MAMLTIGPGGSFGSMAMPPCVTRGTHSARKRLPPALSLNRNRKCRECAHGCDWNTMLWRLLRSNGRVMTKSTHARATAAQRFLVSPIAVSLFQLRQDLLDGHVAVSGKQVALVLAAQILEPLRGL